MCKSLLAFILVCLLPIPLTAQQKSNDSNPNVIIVLDASGSMWGKIRGRAKIDIAKEVIEKVTAELSPDINLGLVVYGHRKKGDCADIELLIPPSKLDKKSFNAKVVAIQPKGMTPLTSAVEFAAENLKYKEQRASVILITDGKETCDRDPCKIADILEENGIDFTAHVVAFDLNAKDAKSVECIASKTGGRFLKAADTNTLKDALEIAIDDSKTDEEPEEKLDPATIKAPAEVVQGTDFKVEWTGPNNKGDYITIVEKGAEKNGSRNYAYTKNGSPLIIRAIHDLGPAEIRYKSASGKILGTAAITITKATFALKANETATAGSLVPIEWSGPFVKGDYITIVPKDTEDGKYLKYTYTKSPEETLKVLAPLKVGPAEIRLMSDQGNKVLARRDIEISEPDFILSAAESIPAGSMVKVTWKGPNNPGDFVTIVPKQLEDGEYAKYTYTKNGSPLKILSPTEPGPAEIRYMSGQGNKVVARREIDLTKPEFSLTAADQAMAGSPVKIAWTAVQNANDFITIVRADAEEGTYNKYAYLKVGSPLSVLAPLTNGPHEIRLLSNQGYKTLARRPIQLTPFEITFKGPAEATVSETIHFEWSGATPGNDFFTIVPKDTEEGKYAKYVYAKKGDKLSLEAPDKPGDYEIRYLSNQGYKTLFSHPIKIKSATKEEQ